MTPPTLLAAMPEWQAHVEVWLLVAAVAGLGIYAAKVIQPKMVAAGEPPITTRQKVWFWGAVAVLWIASDFPIHEIAEQRLYSVHMAQHSLLMVVFPPMLLLATPTWLARLLLGNGRFKRVFSYWARPAPALLVNLGLTAAMHSAMLVNAAAEIGWVHFLIHTVAIASSFLVWMCICGPLPELQVTPPFKMLVLFLLSIIPTIPMAFLAAAETVLYEAYDQPIRLWGLSVVQDQQLAGAMMKVVTGSYLWVIIAVIFFRWTLGERGEKKRYRGKLVTSAGDVVEPVVPGDRVASGSGARSGGAPASGLADPPGPRDPRNN